jgi:glycosyltransferase involved in cell wall biosynthesis
MATVGTRTTRERRSEEDSGDLALRICMVVSVIAPLGGIEAALTTLARELGRQGSDVSVYSLERPGSPNQNADALAREGIPISSPSAAAQSFHRWAAGRHATITLGLSAIVLLLLFPLIVVSAATGRRPLHSSLGRARWNLQRWFMQKLDFERLLYLSLSRQLRRTAPDLVHVHGWGCGEDPPGALAWLRTQPYPIVYTEHNSPDPRLHAPIAHSAVENADVLIAVSEAGRSGLETVGRTSRPIRVVPYGVDPLPAPTRPTRSAPEDFVITCVARLAPQKGHADLIAALARLRKLVPRPRLLLAGEGPLERDLLADAERLGVQDCVSFLGLVGRFELANLFAETDVVALPSYWEGLPIALIEALSAGKPIVASDAGGNPELVLEGENGLIVPIGDPAALAEALLRLAGDPDERRRMGAAARTRYERGEFDPAAVARRHLEVYRVAVGLSRERAAARLAA